MLQVLDKLLCEWEIPSKGQAFQFGVPIPVNARWSLSFVHVCGLSQYCPLEHATTATA